LFIDDNKTSSLIVNGKKYKHYNVKYNRLKSKLDEEISNNISTYKEVKNKKNEIIKIPLEYNKRGIELKSFKKYITYKRNEYYENEFQQLSKKIVIYLKDKKVNELIISKNLIEGKQKGEIKLRKGVKQSFYNIPYGKLLNYIEEKCQEEGIIVVNIDESFTSKSSCISGNVKEAQNLCQNLRNQKNKVNNEEYKKLKEIYKEKLSTVLNGKRAKRGLYKDFLINKILNADLNGAVNHLKVWNNKNYKWLENYLFKLCNPIKINNLREFDILLTNKN
jgi:IS605 OrfB family transposase